MSADSNMTTRVSFSREGFGKFVAGTFEKAISSRQGVYPNVPRGQTLLMAADFGGQHAGQYFDTYAFLFLDLERIQYWFSELKEFRKNYLRTRRRMAFKSLNDNNRRRALIPFLRLANELEGCLVLFAISKSDRSMFATDQKSAEVAELLSLWKPHVQERLLRIVHLSAFLTSGLSANGQDLLWFVDEDEIASNVDQLTRLTEIYARVSSNYLEHDMRHVRCGTARSDDGTLILEDLIAIPDLSAGALCEIGTAMMAQGLFPRRGLVTPLPTGIAPKSRLIGSWLGSDFAPLRKFSYLIELDPYSPKWRLTHMRWHVESLNAPVILDI